MLQITVYENLDPKQPIVFTGQSPDTILRKLRELMESNNGEWRNRKWTHPCQIDGLCFVDISGDSILIVRDEYCEEWSAQVYFNTNVLTNDSYMFNDVATLVTGDWNTVLDKYISLVRDFGRFEEAK